MFKSLPTEPSRAARSSQCMRTTVTAPQIELVERPYTTDCCIALSAVSGR